MAVIRGSSSNSSVTVRVYQENLTNESLPRVYLRRQSSYPQHIGGTTMTAPANTREYKGLTIPTPGKFDIDPAHTRVSFTARHMMVSKVRGGFTSASGSIVIAEDPLQSHVEVSIDAAS